MTDPIRYVSLVGAVVTAVTTSASPALFYTERKEYRRRSQDGMTLSRPVCNNIASLGVYGIYWCLKASFALSLRNRLPSLVSPCWKTGLLRFL